MNIDTLLRANDPGADTPDYNDAQRRETLTRAIAPASPSAHGRGWRIGAAAAGIVTVLALAVGNLGGSHATARAEELLTEAAINATDPPSEPSQYWKVTETRTQGSGEACDEHSTVTSYLSADGNSPSVYVENYESAPGCPPAGDDRVWTLVKSPNQLIDTWRWPSPSFLESLPRDVEQLRAQLYADAEGISPTSTDAGVFALILNALTYGAPPADLRSALLRGAGDRPRDRGGGRDGRGRSQRRTLQPRGRGGHGDADDRPRSRQPRWLPGG